MRAPAVNHGDALCAEFFRLHCGVDGRHSSTYDHDLSTHGYFGQVTCLSKVGNKVNGVANAAGLGLRDSNAVDTREPHAKKNSVVVFDQSLQRHVFSQLDVVTHFNAAYG